MKRGLSGGTHDRPLPTTDASEVSAMSSAIIQFPSPHQNKRPEYEFYHQGIQAEVLRVSSSFAEIRQRGRRPRWVSLTAIERQEVRHALYPLFDRSERPGHQRTFTDPLVAEKTLAEAWKQDQDAYLLQCRRLEVT